MARHYLFADESGNFDFSRGRGATRYFAVGTIHVVGDQSVEALRSDLLRLQTDLAWDRVQESGGFHASEDKQAARDAVFEVLRRQSFLADVTILEKSKAQPHLRSTDPRFFQHAWYYHFKNIAPLIQRDDELMVVAAAVGTKRLRALFRRAIENVVQQRAWHASPRVLFMPCAADPALQAADYVLWAVMRAWERGDSRAVDPLLPRIRSQFDVFARGSTHHY